MHLDKLEIQGFKSFRDKTALEFPSQLTEIVGPNGSGKSNIIDSICFVLGHSRGLRANNLTELICNGGIGGKESEFARVSMYLSNGDNKKIKITREVDRAGKSIYKLDDKRISRQEIIEIVGDNEYNIILQDDVTKVIEMKPKERRQILDELCGIAEYDKKKEKAIEELARVETKISETHIVLGEKQGYLEKLSKEKEDAINYQNLQDELKRYKGSILQQTITENENKGRKLEEKAKELDREKERGTEKISMIKSEIPEKNKELKETNEKLFALEEEKSGSRIAEVKGEIARKQDRIDSLKNSIEDVNRRTSENKEKRHNLNEDEKKINSEIGGLTKKLGSLSSRIDEESKKSGGIESGGRTDELKMQIFDLRSRISALSEIKEKNVREIETVERERDDIEKRIKDLLKGEETLARRIDEKSIEYKSNFEEFEKLRKDLPGIIKKTVEIQRELERLQIELAGKKTEVSTIEKTSGGVNRATSAVLGLKKIVHGIYGTVSQLGCASDSEYETALKVAAGNRMQNIVVENEDTAVKCIEYLRKKQIGRATFLPLNKINVRIEENCPGGAMGFARNFITTPEKFRKVFNFVLGNTLIVKDLANAKSIGIGSWRMTTLDGDLIEPSGAMSGGYIKKIEMSFSNTEELENEIISLEKRVLELDGERQELELKKIKIEGKLSELESPVSKGNTEIEGIRIEKNALLEKRKEYKERVNLLEEKIKSIKKEISEIESNSKSIQNDITAHEKHLEKLLKTISEEGNISELEKLKDEYRDFRIEENKLKERRGFIQKQINDLKKEIDTLEKQKDSMEKDIEEATKSRTGLEKELKEREKESADIINKMGSMMDKRSKIEEKITELGSEVGKIEHELDGINEKIGKIDIEMAKIETKISDLQQEFEPYSGIETIDKKISELESEVGRIETEMVGFGAINMKAIETYDAIKAELDEVTEKLETLKNERQSIFNFMEKVESKKRETFMKTFDVVKQNFEQIFRDISGGEGTLTLDNPKEISESGLLITASPKEKKFMSLDAMSGGEKVLTSSAFLLAIQRYKPSDFYIVDELDAALDKENSAKIAEMLKNSTAQFVLITHNDQVMKFADSVIGVSMSNGVSQVVGVKLSDNT